MRAPHRDCSFSLEAVWVSFAFWLGAKLWNKDYRIYWLLRPATRAGWKSWKVRQVGASGRMRSRRGLLQKASSQAPVLLSDGSSSLPGSRSWRRAARDGQLVLPAAYEKSFAQLVVGDPRAGAHDDQCCCGAISIETGGIVVRVPVDISAARLGDIILPLQLT